MVAHSGIVINFSIKVQMLFQLSCCMQVTKQDLNYTSQIHLYLYVAYMYLAQHFDLNYVPCMYVINCEH